ncbi:anti-sigma factor [soil metagenome]
MTEPTDFPFPDAPFPEERAAEYALGVLTADERAAAERQMRADPRFADQVAAWDARLAPMIDAVAPVTPPRVVWLRIAGQLGLLKTPANDNEGFWGNVAIWRAGTGAFAVAAAAAVAMLVFSPGAPTPVVSTPVVQEPVQQPISVGMLKAEDGPVSFVVTLDRQNHRLIIAPLSGAPEGHSFEMWMLPDGKPPVSMGSMDGADVVVIDAAKLLGASGGKTPGLAVSVEPKGGSPTGLPTGPVIASGALQPV